MGSGIAQWVSSRGCNVLLKDVNDDLISKGLKQIGKLYVQGVLGYKMDRPTARDGLSRIATTSKNVPLDNQDILIEAIVEKLDVKQQVLAELEEKLSDNAIIATNTSALSIDDMASALKHPERFVGIHFFNPVHKMKLVEVVRGKLTSDETVHRAVEFVKSIGKLPVVVNDSPGFVVNRILVPYLISAMDLHDRGYSIDMVDSIIMQWGMPMGPFRLMDEVGIDVCQHVAKHVCTSLNKKMSTTLERMIENGKLGKKAGEGFYKYKKGKSIKSNFTSDLIQQSTSKLMLMGPMVYEARQVLEEGVIEDADMLDLAMIMGTGWAPFRGGPIRYSLSLDENKAKK
jgi:3-hydroxyacyl-CoA dehydrogenase/enoyl-CoA hydratase/3-hydroxybutyryl-CoA epimerase